MQAAARAQYLMYYRVDKRVRVTSVAFGALLPGGAFVAKRVSDSSRGFRVKPGMT
jgi:hypothetical protein